MNAPSSAVALAPERQGASFSLAPRNFDEAWRLADILADSDLVPKDFRGKPGNCLVAIQWGNEIGLGALQSLQNIAVINGRPSLWGDAVIALARSSPLCEYIVETDDGHTATCRVKRRGEPEQIRTFDMDDAKKAGLAGKQGPWQQFPKRMRQMRARAFALRDVFPDVLKGIPMAEELQDMPPERHMGMVDEVASPKPGLPPYPDADFTKNLPQWRDLVESGRKTPEALLAALSTKATFSDAQRAAILALGAAPAQDEPAVAETAGAASDEDLPWKD